jgi:transposase
VTLHKKNHHKNMDLIITGIPVTQAHNLNELQPFVAHRPITQYWNETKPLLFRRIWDVNQVSQSDSQFETTDLSWNGVDHPSWFLVRMLQGSTPQSNIYHIEIESDDVAQLLAEQNDKHNKALNRRGNMQAGRKLTQDFKITKDDKNNMTKEELKAKTQRKKDEVARIRSELHAESLTSRMRLFHLHGSRKQFNFLRQQRGCMRLLYNQALADFRNQVQTNRNNFARYASVIMDYEFDSGVTVEDMRLMDEQTWRLVDWMPFEMDYFRNAYRNDDSQFCRDRPWFTASTTSNLRDAVLSNLETNIHQARKKGVLYKMKYLSKRDDRWAFSIPISKQQINIQTGVVKATPQYVKRKCRRVSRCRRRNREVYTRRTKKTRKRGKPNVHAKSKKTVVFQYMSRNTPGKGVFTIQVADKDQFPNSKSDFVHDPMIVSKNGTFYLAVVEDVVLDIGDPNTPKTRVCSGDPGSKTFLTVFDHQTSTIHEIGTTLDKLPVLRNKRSHLSTHARLERLRRQQRRIQSFIDVTKKSCIAHSQKRHTRKRLKRLQRAMAKRRLQRKRLVAEMHYKTVKFIWDRCDVFIMPYFDTKNILRRQHRRSKPHLGELNFSLFRQRLVQAAERQGKVWLEASEAYTTKQCVMCSHINNAMTLRDRMFDCLRCPFVMNRDAYSSVAISVRNIREGVPQ